MVFVTDVSFSNASTASFPDSPSYFSRQLDSPRTGIADEVVPGNDDGTVSMDCSLYSSLSSTDGTLTSNNYVNLGQSSGPSSTTSVTYDNIMDDDARSSNSNSSEYENLSLVSSGRAENNALSVNNGKSAKRLPMPPPASLKPRMVVDTTPHDDDNVSQCSAGMNYGPVVTASNDGCLSGNSRARAHAARKNTGGHVTGDIKQAVMELSARMSSLNGI